MHAVSKSSDKRHPHQQNKRVDVFGGAAAVDKDYEYMMGAAKKGKGKGYGKQREDRFAPHNRDRDHPSSSRPNAPPTYAPPPQEPSQPPQPLYSEEEIAAWNEETTLKELYCNVCE